MIKLPDFNDDERKKFDEGVFLLSGKAKNRTALGIIDAFLHLYPHATFADLKEAFPDTINPSGPIQVKSLFKPTTDRLLGIVHPGSLRKEFEAEGIDISHLFFIEPDPVFKTADGIEVLVVKAWHGDDDLQRLIDRAKEFGIVVKNFEKVKPGERGSYSWDVLNPILVKKIQEPETKKIQEPEAKKKFPYWIIILIILLLIPLILWLMGVFNKKEFVPVAPKADTIKAVKPVQKQP